VSASKWSLSRRTVLRGVLGGVGTCVSLPLLESMLDSRGEALASGAPMPDRFGIWFWGNGIRPERWIPTGSGPWQPSEELAPLAELVPYVSVVTGSAIAIEDGLISHHSGMTGIMTGRNCRVLGYTGGHVITTFDRASVDQDAADLFAASPAGQAPFRSIEVGVCHFMGAEGGTTFQHLSHNGPNNPNPSEYSPSALYQRLFGGAFSPAVDLARQSVLDAVTQQAGDLRRRLGARDVERLDQHLESMRSLELRLASSSTLQCEPGEAPVDLPSPGGLEPIVENNALMSRVLAMALSCDLTRVFTVQFSTCGAATLFWQVGAADGMHLLCHSEPLPQPTVHAATVFTMGQLAEFLRTLRDMPEGPGNLLDHCSILCTSEHSDGMLHNFTEFPLMVAGLGNGRLRGGVHVPRPADGGWRNASDVVLTALMGAGLPATSFGEEVTYSDQPVSELFS
jgi:hypothetical protein